MRGILVTIIFAIIFGTTAVILWLRDKRRTDEIVGEIDTYYSILKEKRKSIRLTKHLSVVCKVIERPDSHWSVFSKDVSGEGICLHLPEILPQDAVVNLEIKIPPDKFISAQGEVVWIKEIDTPDKDGKRQFDAGIRFIKINNKHKDDLVKFIAASLETQ